MEELIHLRKHIQEKSYEEALRLVDELEEMSKEDKLNKIYSFSYPIGSSDETAG